MDRRTFLQSGALVGASGPALFLPRAAHASFAQSPAIPKFVTPLRRPGADIPVLAPAPTPGAFGTLQYPAEMREFTDQILPPGFGPTRLWGYAPPGVPGRHLGGIVVAQRDTPILLNFRNLLPGTHLLPVDRSLAGAAPPDNRTVVHLHGGKVPWTSDGGPLAWFSPGAAAGPEFARVQEVLPTETGSASYYYPNRQSARMMWLHDHALAITRLNAYAGLATAYILTDAAEAQLQAAGLPGPLHERTHYLVVQDKIFTSAGELWYPGRYDTEMFELGTSSAGPLPVPSVVPEVFGDTMLVNGTTYPTLSLPQGVHRLRMLNACNGRFLAPRLVYAQTGAPSEPNLHAPGPGFLQIGTEGGFLPTPVPVNAPARLELVLAPAERADLLVDLRSVPAGSVLILCNDAAAPFPNGARELDFFPGNPRTPSSRPGFGPNTRTLLQLVVQAAANPAPAPILPQDLGAYAEPLLVAQVPGIPGSVPPSVSVRRLSLNESFDEYGRLLPLLGTMTPNASGTFPPEFGLPFHHAPTEVVREGTTEVWELYNLSADAHPVHFHLVNVQILNRQRLATAAIRRGRTPVLDPARVQFTGKPVAPDANELGWKDTVRVNPGEVTRVIMRFEGPGPLPFTVPLVSGTDANGTPYAGYSFVWHCHILEHEDHDMMRPLIVRP